MKTEFSRPGAAQGPDCGGLTINHGDFLAPERDADARAPH